MTEFTTPKGTKLPLISLQGKDYLPVAQRIRWFREEFPLGRIQTDRISESEKSISYRAVISVPRVDNNIVLDKNAPNTWLNSVNYVTLSNADKTKEIKSTKDYEMCETGAIGRALALAGFGTAFAVDDLDEGDVADAPIEKGKHGTSGVSSKVAKDNTARLGEVFTRLTSPTEVITNWGPVGFDPDEPIPFENSENPAPNNLTENATNKEEAAFRKVPEPNGKEYFLDQEVDGEERLTAGKHSGKTYHELMLDDEKNDFSYARWIMRLIHADEKVGIYLRKYVTYVKQEGRGGVWL